MATNTYYVWQDWNSTSSMTSVSYAYTNTCWERWNATVTTYSTTTDSSWYNWTGTTAYSTTTTDNSIWYQWTEEGYRAVDPYAAPRITKQERRRMRARTNRLERRTARKLRKDKAKRALRELKKQEAEEKARELLLDLIGPEQMAVYERTGRVFVKGREYDWLLRTIGDRCRLLKIKKDMVHDLCIHIDEDRIPKTDQVIGYLLHAKFNEKELDKTANVQETLPKKHFEVAIQDAANA